MIREVLMRDELAKKILAQLPQSAGLKVIHKMPTFESVSDPGLVPPDEWLVKRGKKLVAVIPSDSEDAIYLRTGMSGQLREVFQRIVDATPGVEIKEGMTNQYQEYLNRVYGSEWKWPSWARDE